MARYERGTEELSRVVAFSDAVFAIAMTLLVVGIAVPTVKASELNPALQDLIPDISAFFISFVVIGKFWMAHHRFFSRLRAVDTRLMTANLLYLATIAFVPFPTALVSRYEDSPITVVIYALALGAASLMETVMLLLARRDGELRQNTSREVFRYELIGSLLPVTMFAISVPISFVSTTGALLSWILIFPGERLVTRLAPAGYAGDE